jgi:hypothetical protein
MGLIQDENCRSFIIDPPIKQFHCGFKKWFVVDYHVEKQKGTDPLLHQKSWQQIK